MTSVVEVPNARHLGLFTDREEWLKVRESGIGGSEVAVICGLSKWESPFTLWCKKTGVIKVADISDREPVEWGNRLESVIIDKFEDVHPELEVLRDVGTYANNTYEWQRANPDFLYRTPEGVLGLGEVKTATYESDWTDGIPKYYFTQVQWYLQCLGLSEGVVIVLFHGNKYREYPVMANRLEQEINLEKVIQFKHYLDTNTAPDFDGSNSTYETVRELHPEINPDLEVELGELGAKYFEAEEASKNINAVLLEFKALILAKMGVAKTGTVEGKAVFTRSARGVNGIPFLTVKKGIVD